MDATEEYPYPVGWVCSDHRAEAAVAGRHIYLQNLPADQIPECGPGLEFMLSNMPLADALQKALAGSGECADVSWTFLGLSMPWWTLFWYLVLSALMITAARR